MKQLFEIFDIPKMAEKGWLGYLPYVCYLHCYYFGLIKKEKETRIYGNFGTELFMSCWSIIWTEKMVLWGKIFYPVF